MSTKTSRALGQKMRVIHRYLGFFLAGIMAVYALSGIIMIFRETDFLKQEVVAERQLSPGRELQHQNGLSNCHKKGVTIPAQQDGKTTQGNY